MSDMLLVSVVYRTMQTTTTQYWRTISQKTPSVVTEVMSFVCPSDAGVRLRPCLSEMIRLLVAGHRAIFRGSGIRSQSLVNRTRERHGMTALKQLISRPRSAVLCKLSISVI